MLPRELLNLVLIYTPKEVVLAFGRTDEHARCTLAYQFALENNWKTPVDVLLSRNDLDLVHWVEEYFGLCLSDLQRNDYYLLCQCAYQERHHVLDYLLERFGHALSYDVESVDDTYPKATGGPFMQRCLYHSLKSDHHETFEVLERHAGMETVAQCIRNDNNSICYVVIVKSDLRTVERLFTHYRDCVKWDRYILTQTLRKAFIRRQWDNVRYVQQCMTSYSTIPRVDSYEFVSEDELLLLVGDGDYDILVWVLEQRERWPKITVCRRLLERASGNRRERIGRYLCETFERWGILDHRLLEYGHSIARTWAIETGRHHLLTPSDGVASERVRPESEYRPPAGIILEHLTPGDVFSPSE